MTLKCIIRFGTILIFVLCTTLQDTFSQDNEPVSASKTETIVLTLNEAIDFALKSNRNLLQSGYTLQNQQLSLKSIQSDFDTKIKPFSRAGIDDGRETFGGGVGFEKTFYSGIRATIQPGVEWADDEYAGTTAVSLGIPLLRGVGKKVNLDPLYGSQFSLRSAERTMYTNRMNVVLDTVAAVYDIKKQIELVSLYAFQRDQLEGHAATAKIKESVGLASPIDIYRAEIRKKDAENSLSAARESLANAEDRLKLLLSLPLEKNVNVLVPMGFEPLGLSLSAATGIALSNRIEIEQRKDEIAEARRNSEVAKHNLLPRLDLVMDYKRFGFSDEFSESVTSGDDRWAINLISDTDWARKREKNTHRQSMLNVKTAELNLNQQKDQIKRDVRRELEALEKDLESIEIRKAQVQQAESKLALAKVKFNYDMADNFDVIEAETERQRAKVDLLSTKIDYIVGTYRLRSVLGTLIDR